MKNVQMTIENGILVIRIDPKQRLERSKSGKTTIVASTAGNVPVPGNPDVKIGVNVFTS